MDKERFTGRARGRDREAYAFMYVLSALFCDYSWEYCLRNGCIVTMSSFDQVLIVRDERRHLGEKCCAKGGRDRVAQGLSQAQFNFSIYAVAAVRYFASEVPHNGRLVSEACTQCVKGKKSKVLGQKGDRWVVSKVQSIKKGAIEHLLFRKFASFRRADWTTCDLADNSRYEEILPIHMICVLLLGKLPMR